MALALSAVGCAREDASDAPQASTLVAGGASVAGSLPAAAPAAESDRRGQRVTTQPGGAGPPSTRPRAEQTERLHEVRLAHEAADAAMSEADKRGALVRLRNSVRALRPNSKGQIWAYQDGCARIAGLALDLADEPLAAQAVAQGLSLGRQPSVPVAHLLEVQGKLFERKGRKQAAAAAYHDALKVNQELMKRSLGISETGAQ